MHVSDTVPELERKVVFYGKSLATYFLFTSRLKHILERKPEWNNIRRIEIGTNKWQHMAQHSTHTAKLHIQLITNDILEEYTLGINVVTVTH